MEAKIIELMQDTFKPLSLTISQIFIDGDPLYNIPNYQRPYSWVDEQVEKLDIKTDTLKIMKDKNKADNM